MKNKIRSQETPSLRCKCGHESGQHTDFTFTGVGECQMPDCTCKKFEAQGCKDCLVLHSPQNCPKNHNESEVPMDEETRLKASGSDNSPQENSNFTKTLNSSDKPADTLSSKIDKLFQLYISTGMQPNLFIQELKFLNKEFIKKILDTPLEHLEAWQIRALIKNLAGKELL